MSVERIKRELEETVNKLKQYQNDKSNNEIQIAYLTMKSKYLLEQINSVNVAQEVIGKSAA